MIHPGCDDPLEGRVNHKYRLLLSIYISSSSLSTSIFFSIRARARPALPPRACPPCLWRLALTFDGEDTNNREGRFSFSSVLHDVLVIASVPHKLETTTTIT
jgi:hypothetical protein